MKQLRSLFVVLLLVLSLFAVAPSAFADEHETTEETEVTVDVEADATVTTESDDAAEDVVEETTQEAENQAEDAAEEVENAAESTAEEVEEETTEAELEASVESEELTEEELEEVATIDGRSGAEVRLLQLKLAVTRNLLFGQEVYSYLEAELSAEDADLLSANIAKLESILEDIESFDFDRSNDEMALDFVALKRESIAVSHSFKAVASTYLDEENREAIKAALEASDFEELETIREEVETKRSEHNAVRLQELATKLGIELDADFVAQVESGEADVGEVRAQIREAFTALPPQERRAVVSNAQENAAKRRVEVQAKATKARAEVKERVEVRIEAREDIAAQKREEVQARIEARRSDVKERIETRVGEARTQVRTEVRERVDENKVEAKGRMEVRADGVRERTEIRIKDGREEVRVRVDADNSGSGSSEDSEGASAESEEVEGEENDAQ